MQNATCNISSHKSFINYDVLCFYKHEMKKKIVFMRVTKEETKKIDVNK